MKELPKIRIQFNRFLEPVFANHYKLKHPDWEQPQVEEIVERVEQNKILWEKEEAIILNGLMDVLELDYEENIINVYIISGYRGAFSNPTVLNWRLQGTKFVDILTHELIHRLLTFNKQNIPTGEILRTMFPEVTDLLTINHIVLHAVHQYLYLDVLKVPERFDEDISSSQNKMTAYQAAWDIVTQQGYKNIIERFKSHYI